MIQNEHQLCTHYQKSATLASTLSQSLHGLIDPPIEGLELVSNIFSEQLNGEGYVVIRVLVKFTLTSARFWTPTTVFSKNR